VSGHQKAVLWIGLIIVAANLVMKWPSVRSIIFSGSGGSTSNANPNSGGISTVPGVPAPGGGGITVPFGGFPFTIPFSSTSSSATSVQVLVMAAQKKQQQQPGYDIVVTTAFELIGVGLMSLLAGISDQMGTVVVLVMCGFLLGWLIINSGTLAKWVSNI
jgi:hypothetical protein